MEFGSSVYILDKCKYDDTFSPARAFSADPASNGILQSAADISDFHKSSLQNYLINSYEQYDEDRYECYGCSIFISGQHMQPQGNITFVCKDKIENKYVKFCPLKDITLDEIFSIFKRFQVVIGDHLDKIEVDDKDYLDLK